MNVMYNIHFFHKKTVNILINNGHIAQVVDRVSTQKAQYKNKYVHKQDAF